jgi:AcrR family transcriptional regulator
MGQKRATTRSRLLSLGLDTLSAEGLAGLTIGRLAADAQMSKSGLFAHFRSKEQLQLELLEEATKLADAEVVAPAMQAQEGLPRLRALFAKWLGWSSRAGLRGGCPVAARSSSWTMQRAVSSAIASLSWTRSGDLCCGPLPLTPLSAAT